MHKALSLFATQFVNVESRASVRRHRSPNWGLEAWGREAGDVGEGSKVLALALNAVEIAV